MNARNEKQNSMRERERVHEVTEAGEGNWRV